MENRKVSFKGFPWRVWILAPETKSIPLSNRQEWNRRERLPRSIGSWGTRDFVGPALVFRVTLSHKGWIGFSRTPHSDALFSGHITLDGRSFQGEPLGFGVQ